MLCSFKGIHPEVEEGVFVAPGAWLIGQVKVKSGGSVWFNAVLRGDANAIEVGRETNIQDNSILHPDDQHPVILGNQVTIGHGCILHGCLIRDGAVVGMGSVVLSGAEIGEEAVIAAGALVTDKVRIPRRSLAVGRPAKVIRTLTEDELDKYRVMYVIYRERAKVYMRELSARLPGEVACACRLTWQ
ncbi:MAG: gamma carbonic anhydrase family protein [Synergistales bacterium]|nr:gamma carbonic anhydrase family protein [Synergistales bacterium]